tara:strand:- start:331 stop:897 length:567 start_codon:yes stop_codon:yes gene_type:complete
MLKEELHLVVARYNEDLSWVEDLGFKYTIYNKGEDISLPCIKRENFGREGETYLNHIVSNYDSIDSTTVFLQGHPFDHLTENQKDLKTFLHNIGNDLTFVGDSYVSNGDGYPHHGGLPVSETARLLGVQSEDNRYNFCPGAQFAVPASMIKNKPLSYWQFALDYFMKSPDIMGYVYERLFPLMFLNKT